MADAPKLLSVIVPVYNERNTVGEIVRRVRLVELPVELEVLVVDDGSDDGTDQVLRLVEDSTVRVIRHPVNRGKGAAVRTGLDAARGDLILVQDADLEYDPQDWPRLLAPILAGKTRVVFGSRYIGEREATSFFRWLGDRALSLTTSVLYNTTISDMETCYKLIGREVLAGLDLQSEGFDIEPEITAKLLRQGHRVYEVPVSYASRTSKEGRKFNWRDGLVAFGTLVRCRFR
jgi:glycosyltransferase involved in cell wall biosynthesis